MCVFSRCSDKGWGMRQAGCTVRERHCGGGAGWVILKWINLMWLEIAFLCFISALNVKGTNMYRGTKSFWMAKLNGVDGEAPCAGSSAAPFKFAIQKLIIVPLCRLVSSTSRFSLIGATYFKSFSGSVNIVLLTVLSSRCKKLQKKWTNSHFFKYSTDLLHQSQLFSLFQSTCTMFHKSHMYNKTNRSWANTVWLALMGHLWSCW